MPALVPPMVVFAAGVTPPPLLEVRAKRCGALIFETNGAKPPLCAMRTMRPSLSTVQWSIANDVRPSYNFV